MSRARVFRSCSIVAALIALTAAARDGGSGEEAPGERQARGAAAVREFRRLHPCPATGQARGACPGWVVDHVMPLCAGGPDRPDNMQWQTVGDSKAKDRDERRQCRELKR